MSDQTLKACRDAGFFVFCVAGTPLRSWNALALLERTCIARSSLTASERRESELRRPLVFVCAINALVSGCDRCAQFAVTAVTAVT